MTWDNRPAIWRKSGMTGEDIELIEHYKFRRGSLLAERRNRGYTLIHAQTGCPGRPAAPIRARPFIRTPLLVFGKASLDAVRPVRKNGGPSRRRPPAYRRKFNFLGRPLRRRQRQNVLSRD